MATLGFLLYLVVHIQSTQLVESRRWDDIIPPCLPTAEIQSDRRKPFLSSSLCTGSLSIFQNEQSVKTDWKMIKEVGHFTDSSSGLFPPLGSAASSFLSIFD